MPSILPKMPSFRSHEELVAAAAAASRRPSGPPDFVVKLFQMLQQEDTDLIAWDNGRIIMMNPAQLANEVLPKYFRHSRFSSFQRQLNNFGFRKIEGKGKLVPCMYARDDLEGQQPIALLSIRRKAASSNAKETSSFGTITTSAGVGSIRNTLQGRTDHLRPTVTDYRFRNPSDMIVGDESNPYKVEYPIKRRRMADGSSRITRSSEIEQRPERDPSSIMLARPQPTSELNNQPCISNGKNLESFLTATRSPACSTKDSFSVMHPQFDHDSLASASSLGSDMDSSVSSECELTGQFISDTLGDFPITTSDLLDTLTLLDVDLLDQHDPLNLLPTLPAQELVEASSPTMGIKPILEEKQQQGSGVTSMPGSSSSSSSSIPDVSPPTPLSGPIDGAESGPLGGNPLKQQASPNDMSGLHQLVASHTAEEDDEGMPVLSLASSGKVSSAQGVSLGKVTPVLGSFLHSHNDSSTRQHATPTAPYAASIFGKRHPVPTGGTSGTYFALTSKTDPGGSQAKQTIRQHQLPTLALPVHDQAGTPSMMGHQFTRTQNASLKTQPPPTTGRTDLNPFQASLFGKKYRIALQG